MPKGENNNRYMPDTPNIKMHSRRGNKKSRRKQKEKAQGEESEPNRLSEAESYPALGQQTESATASASSAMTNFMAISNTTIISDYCTPKCDSTPFYQLVVQTACQSVLDQLKRHRRAHFDSSVEGMDKLIMLSKEVASNIEINHYFNIIEQQIKQIENSCLGEAESSLEQAMQSVKDVINWLRLCSMNKVACYNDSDQSQLATLPGDLFTKTGIQPFLELALYTQQELEANPADYCIARLCRDYVVPKYVEHVLTSKEVVNDCEVPTHEELTLVADHLAKLVHARGTSVWRLGVLLGCFKSNIASYQDGTNKLNQSHATANWADWLTSFVYSNHQAMKPNMSLLKHVVEQIEQDIDLERDCRPSHS